MTLMQLMHELHLHESDTHIKGEAEQENMNQEGKKPYIQQSI